MSTSSVNLLGQVDTVAVDVTVDPTSNKNMGLFQAELFQLYGLTYFGGQYAQGRLTLQVQDINQPQLTVAQVQAAVSQCLSDAVGDPGNNWFIQLPVIPSASAGIQPIVPPAVQSAGAPDACLPSTATYYWNQFMAATVGTAQRAFTGQPDDYTKFILAYDQAEALIKAGMPCSQAWAQAQQSVAQNAVAPQTPNTLANLVIVIILVIAAIAIFAVVLKA
jgi:hypothetical protein